MKYSSALCLLLAATPVVQAGPLVPAPKISSPRGTSGSKHLRPVLERRQEFNQGEPIDGTGKGGPILGGTDHQIDLQNPDNLGEESTDAGLVVNLKWSFSDSKTKIFNGGWTREQVVTDIPASTDIAGAQQHLKKGSYRELHWHRVAEWGFLYSGSLLLSAVDENGKNTQDTLKPGDIWYFPKGAAHTVQGMNGSPCIKAELTNVGLEDDNEYLLVFDDGNFDATGTTFMVDDWIAHTPKDILAKNFGVDSSVFSTVPATDPYIVKGNGNVSTIPAKSPYGALTGNSSYVYYGSQQPATNAPGGGGTIQIVDSRNFPIATTIAAAIVTVEPKGLRELHWHPTAAEWIYFHSGQAKATVFLGGANARTFDFTAGDTAVFPDNSGHYVENTSETEKLVWIEIYKADRVADISLTQWLALTPPEVVATTLNIPLSVVENLKTEKQLIIA